jgi:type IV secretory pathway TrbL component
MQNILKATLPLVAALALCLSASTATADSTASASSASSTSVGSASASIGKSSDSSNSGAKDRVAQGQYRVVDVAEMAHQPNMLRMRLQPLEIGDALASNRAQAFDLVLPRQAADQVQLAVGQTIATEHRPYGLAFAAVTATGNTSPFFLVLDDDWYRELESRPVGI